MEGLRASAHQTAQPIQRKTFLTDYLFANFSAKFPMMGSLNI
jgi:hypothetical protein